MFDFKHRLKICSNFGLKHKFKSCPAYLDTCHACGANGHWSKMCRKTKNIEKPVQTSNVRRGRSKSRQLHHRSNSHREFGELKAEEQSDSEYNSLTQSQYRTSAWIQSTKCHVIMPSQH